MDLVVNADIFGRVTCYMYSVVWQKRGLPHVHILTWLEETIKPDDYDKLLRAEIPMKMIKYLEIS